MKTQKEVYNTIYKSRIFEYKLLFSDDKASRKANIYAVKNAWRLYNDQYKNI